jgi:hypothetical protein
VICKWCWWGIKLLLLNIIIASNNFYAAFHIELENKGWIQWIEPRKVLARILDLGNVSKFPECTHVNYPE